MDLVFKDINVNFGKKEILHEVSGMVGKGEMLAVMGPSGAGKTTLLNAISGRCDITSGHVWLNNQSLNKQLKRKMAYVLQQDIFLSNLTLRETLKYASYLKLPEKMPNNIKDQRVEEIINVLGLTKCSDTVMGDIFTPGLSGGEKKRTSIAMELLTNPLVLLVDEPTSGLDSSSAFVLMTMLKKYTEDTMKTVITAIHQPSSQIFHMFDKLLLLADGQVAYFGKRDGVLDFFSTLGMDCDPHYNPADYILEKCMVGSDSVSQLQNHTKDCRSISWPKELQQQFIDSNAITESNSNMSVNNENGHYRLKKDLSASYDSGVGDCVVGMDLTNKHKRSIINTDEHMELYIDRNQKWATGFWMQFKILFQRNIKQIYKKVFSSVSIVSALIVTIVASIIWFQSEWSEENIMDLMGFRYWFIVFWSFQGIHFGLFAVSLDRHLIDRERASNTYRLSAYYTSLVLSTFMIYSGLPIISYTIVYWMAGFVAKAEIFFATLGITLIGVYTVECIGIFIGVVVTDLRIATSCVQPLMSTFLLSGDYFRRNIPYWFDWVRYLSIFNHDLHACAKLDFLYGPPLKCAPPNETKYMVCRQSNNNMTSLTVDGVTVLKSLEMMSPVWINIVLLVAIGGLFLIGGYLFLRFCHRPAFIRK